MSLTRFNLLNRKDIIPRGIGFVINLMDYRLIGVVDYLMAETTNI